MRKQVGLLFFTLLLTATAITQTNLYIPRNINDAYNKGTRSHDGKPGKAYWQNTGTYTLNINFNPQTLEIKGREEIEYVNNSPDILQEILFKLYPNLYEKGVAREMSVNAADLTDGMQIDTMLINDKTVETDAKGTNLSVKPTEAVLPRAAIRFDINYHYTLNKGSHIRTGEIESGADFIAYFFPRIAVYDDIDGWNKHPYTGSQEFYNDFCNFTVNITVPKDFIIWCTGDLMNGKDVLAEKYVQRLQQAEQSNAVTNIIDSNDISAKHITADKDYNTWIYKATNVTDVAFAVSDHYMWQSSGLVVDKTTGRRTRVDAVFNPKHTDFFKVAGYARKTVEAMSYAFPAWPFPYAHETVFDGLDQMEYPMMVNDNPLEKNDETIELTDHEIFHTMFPFYMGINETKYGWMDEGWATIGEWLVSPMIDSTISDDYGIKPYEEAAAIEEDLPVITLTTQQKGTPFFLNSYPKPALGYLYIKDMLGDALFTKALHHYIETWHGKHPVPYDFFNCMNEGAGKNMNWFWKRWYFDAGYPDLAISNVSKKNKSHTINIISKGSKPVPVDITVYFSDSSTQKIHRNIECWKEGNTDVSISFTSAKKLVRIELGSLYVPDIYKEDNVYLMK